MYNIHKKNGFTLIEILVVTSITMLISVLMVTNLSSKKVDLDDVTKIIVADVRFAQTRALSGANHDGEARCGYGIHMINAPEGTYSIYVGPHADTASTCNNTQYASTEDIEIVTKKLPPGIEFLNVFPDIFFEPPNPKTYIGGGGFQLDGNPATLTVQPLNYNCNPLANRSNCRSVCIYPSGRITTVIGRTCP